MGKRVEYTPIHRTNKKKGVKITFKTKPDFIRKQEQRKQQETWDLTRIHNKLKKEAKKRGQTHL